MMPFVSYPDEKAILHAQIAFQLLDDFTGEPPVGQVSIRLFESDTETPLDVQPKRSSIGMWSFPGLGIRLAEQTEFTAQIKSDYYENVEIDGLNADPYRRDTGLPNRKLGYRVVGLRPNSNYPYPSHIPVIRGRIWNSVGVPAGGASVDYGTAEFTKTDSDGFFSLPIRWLPSGIWPRNEIALTSASRESSLAVTETTGVTEWTRLELVETDASYQLIEDVNDGEFDLPVELDETVDLSGDPDLSFEESYLAPAARRYRIDSDQSSRTNLLLRSPLRQKLSRGTRFSLRTKIAAAAGDPAEDDHLLVVESVNQISSQIKVEVPLQRKWAKGTRVLRYPSRKPDERIPLELDIDDPNPQTDETDEDKGMHQALVAVPDHFRFMDIQIPS